MIAFKRIGSVDEWRKVHPRLREVLEWVLFRWPDAYMEVTRIYDPPVDDESGVHRTRPHRAAIRTTWTPDARRSKTGTATFVSTSMGPSGNSASGSVWKTSA